MIKHKWHVDVVREELKTLTNVYDTMRCLCNNTSWRQEIVRSDFTQTVSKISYITLDNVCQVEEKRHLPISHNKLHQLPYHTQTIFDILRGTPCTPTQENSVPYRHQITFVARICTTSRITGDQTHNFDFTMFSEKVELDFDVFGNMIHNEPLSENVCDIIKCPISYWIIRYMFLKESRLNSVTVKNLNI